MKFSFKHSNKLKLIDRRDDDEDKLKYLALSFIKLQYVWE